MQQFIEQQILLASTQQDETLPKEILNPIHIKVKADLQTRDIYQLLKIVLIQRIRIKMKFQKDQKRKINVNVLFVSHGIMTHEIALQKIRKIFSCTCINAS